MIVPFAVKAAQGDTLEYIWGGGPVRLLSYTTDGADGKHTATLSDGTNVCNKSTEAGAFDSGKCKYLLSFLCLPNFEIDGTDE